MTQNGNYPSDAGIQLAARNGSERYYFRNPTGGISSIPAMDAEQAQKILADRTRGFNPDDFEEVDGFGAEPWEYPDPATSDRCVNEHDIWMLQAAMYKGKRVGIQGKHSPRKNPTKYTIEQLLDHFNSAKDIPLYNAKQLQEVNNIGPNRAAQIVGAAVANNLIKRPERTNNKPD